MNEEIESLKEEYNRLFIHGQELFDKYKEHEDNYISKDKIKAKIKELEEKDKYSTNNVYGYGIYFLKELLGDDNK